MAAASGCSCHRLVSPVSVLVSDGTLCMVGFFGVDEYVECVCWADCRTARVALHPRAVEDAMARRSADARLGHRRLEHLTRLVPHSRPHKQRVSALSISCAPF